MYSSQIIKKAIAQGFREESFPAAVSVANWYLQDLKERNRQNRAKFLEDIFGKLNIVHIIKNIIHIVKGDKSTVNNEKESEREINNAERNGQPIGKNGRKHQK